MSTPTATPGHTLHDPDAYSLTRDVSWPPCEQGTRPLPEYSNDCGPKPAQWVLNLECPKCGQRLHRLYCDDHYKRLVGRGYFCCAFCREDVILTVLYAEPLS